MILYFIGLLNLLESEVSIDFILYSAYFKNSNPNVQLSGINFTNNPTTKLPAPTPIQSKCYTQVKGEQKNVL